MKNVTVLDLVWFILKVLVALAIICLLPFGLGVATLILSKINGVVWTILSTIGVLVVIFLASEKKA